jgi:DNA modification methylase
MGSGTTALSCILLNRRFIGIEIIDEYVKEARKNITELMNDINKKVDFKINLSKK